MAAWVRDKRRYHSDPAWRRARLDVAAKSGETNRRRRKLFVPGYAAKILARNAEYKKRAVENLADWVVAARLRARRVNPIQHPTKEQIDRARAALIAKRTSKLAQLHETAKELASIDPGDLDKIRIHSGPSVKDRKCVACGTTDPGSFYGTCKERCASCTKTALQQRYRTDYEYNLYVRAKRMCRKYAAPGYHLNNADLNQWKEYLRAKDSAHLHGYAPCPHGGAHDVNGLCEICLKSYLKQKQHQ